MRSNNATVAQLTNAQEKARLSRKAAMIEAARQADSYAGGLKSLDAIDLRYQSVFGAFREAERIQAELADVLEALQAAMKAGDSPSLTEMITLFIQLQQVYASLVTAIGEAR